MAEGNAASRYVKLRKEQAPVEDITPGELNQPIDVPQVGFLIYIYIYLRTFLANSDLAPSTVSSDLYPNRVLITEFLLIRIVSCVDLDLLIR